MGKPSSGQTQIDVKITFSIAALGSHPWNWVFIKGELHSHSWNSNTHQANDDDAFSNVYNPK